MIGTVSTLVFAFALLAWMWIFEVRLSRVLDHAETLVDRQHGPTLPPETPRPVVVIEAEPTQPTTEPLPAQPKPRPRPAPATVPSNAVVDTWLAEMHADADAYRAERDRQWAEWRSEMEAK